MESKDKFVFFWLLDGDFGCLSQWYKASFVCDGQRYANAEQFMMAEKARLMGDNATRQEILRTYDPKAIKELGRKVANFVPALWDVHKLAVVVQGNFLKFSQNPALMDLLLSTGDKVLAEASPYDDIWGIGLEACNADAATPSKWPGQNLLGKALMMVRGMLRNSIAKPVGWDAGEFREKYLELEKGLPGTYGKIKQLRAMEYQNTIEIVRQGYYMIGGRKVNICQGEPYTAPATFYDREFDVTTATAGAKTTVVVMKDDCLRVAIGLKQRCLNPAVLNMASRRNPGGGVLTGAGAQEETLFRRTDLFRSLYQFAPYAEDYGLQKSQSQYPLDRDFGGVYTPKALIFRNDETSAFSLMEYPVEMAFISVAAINNPTLVSPTRMCDEHAEATKRKMRTIMRIAISHGHDSLVLGAMGCGAFRNPPSHVARLFHEVFEEPEFKDKIKFIYFAIIDDHNARLAHNPEGNFLPFVKEFHQYE